MVRGKTSVPPKIEFSSDLTGICAEFVATLIRCDVGVNNSSTEHRIAESIARSDHRRATLLTLSVIERMNNLAEV